MKFDIQGIPISGYRSHLAGERAGFRPGAGGFPLALISPASDKRMSSTLLGAGGAPEEAPPLLMNPADAAARGLVDATEVRLWNDLGAVVTRLRVSDVAPVWRFDPEVREAAE